MFLTLRYKKGWLQFSTINNVSRVYVQYWDDQGNYQSERCKSEHAAKCRITRKAR